MVPFCTDLFDCVMKRANKEANARGFTHVTPDAVLIAMIAVADGFMNAAGGDLAMLATQLRSRSPMARLGELSPAQLAVELPISFESGRAVDFATEEAGSRPVSPGHLLIGLIRAMASKPNILTRCGYTLDRVREAVRVVAPELAVPASPVVTPNREGKVVFLERPNTAEDIARGGSAVDYQSGEWLVLKETPSVLYCTKPVGSYGCNDVRTFNLVGNRAWSVVSSSNIDLRLLCDEIEEFIASGKVEKPRWCDSVYSGAMQTLGKLRRIMDARRAANILEIGRLFGTVKESNAAPPAAEWQWPEWIKPGSWLVKSKLGNWLLYSARPTVNSGSWNGWIQAGEYLPIQENLVSFTPPPCDDWRYSARQKPLATEEPADKPKSGSFKLPPWAIDTSRLSSPSPGYFDVVTNYCRAESNRVAAEKDSAIVGMAVAYSQLVPVVIDAYHELRAYDRTVGSVPKIPGLQSLGKARAIIESASTHSVVYSTKETA